MGKVNNQPPFTSLTFGDHTKLADVHVRDSPWEKWTHHVRGNHLLPPEVAVLHPNFFLQTSMIVVDL